MIKKYNNEFASDILQQDDQETEDNEATKRELSLSSDDYVKIRKDFLKKRKFFHKNSVIVCLLILVLAVVTTTIAVVLSAKKLVDLGYRDSFFLETIDKKYDVSAEIKSVSYNNNYFYLVALYDVDTETMDFCIYVTKIDDSVSNIVIEYENQLFNLTVNQRMICMLNNYCDIVDNSFLTIDYNSSEFAFTFTSFIDFSDIKRLLK